MDAAIDPSLVLKTTPPKLRKSLLERERLRRIRADGDDVAVFLVEAASGNGKTSLLAKWRLDWIQSGAVVAWLSMDSEDSPVAVVSGIVLGLRRGTGLAAFGTDAIEAVRRGAGTTLALTSLLAEITDTAKPTVLIFDNCERIRDPAVLEIFDYLLHNLPPNLQIAAGSRTPVPLHTADLVAQGNVRRVTAAELRFDLGETIRLLSARLGERVNADLVASLHEVTEGWPLGVQLAAVALERTTNPAQGVQAFSASRDDSTRQLFDDMVDSLPPGLAAFLTRCALLDAMHPSLCEAVTSDEDAALSLQRLLNETPLLTATEEGEWLRLHPLAREYLRARAERTLTEAERRELHVRAWHWLAAHGFPERAAQHALAAGRQREALTLVAGSLTEEFDLGHVGTVLEWLARIPAREIQRNVLLRRIGMWVKALGYRTSEALPEASALADDPAVEDWVRGEAILALACASAFADEIDKAQRYASRYSGASSDSRGERVLCNLEMYFDICAGATETARQRLARVPDDGSFPTGRIWADYFAAHSYLWEGRPILAEQATRLQVPRWEAQVGRRGLWACMLAGPLAIACWQRDLREEARMLLAHRLDVIEQGTGPDGLAYAYRTLAQMSAADGDEARAFAYLEAFASLGTSRRLMRFVVVSLAERIRLHAAGRRPGQAALLLSELEAVFERSKVCAVLEPLLRLELELARAYVKLASEDARGASDHLAAAWNLARKINRGYETVQILALQALLEEREGQSPSALLTEALSLAEAGGLVRVFADTHPEVVELIRRFAQRGAHAPTSRASIERVLAAANVTATATISPEAQTGSGILTPKENEVLQLLAAGLPNKRIATELGLSSETVKWHVKKLFAKLGAGSRDHAVQRARMLGLVR
jgi:LuxR family maltose regulon positive regulatory protein